MRITSKGQVTIPQAIRDRFGLTPGIEVEFVPVDQQVVVRRAGRTKKGDAADEWLKHAAGSARDRVSTEELMAATRGED